MRLIEDWKASWTIKNWWEMYKDFSEAFDCILNDLFIAELNIFIFLLKLNEVKLNDAESILKIFL